MTLSNLELSMLQGASDAYLPGTAVIWRSTWTSDGQGGGSTAWAAIGTSDCRKGAPRSPAEKMIAARMTESVVWVVTLPHGTDVIGKDRVVISGDTLEVVGPTGSESWPVSKRLIVTETR